MQLIIRELGGWEFHGRKMRVSWQESGSFMAGKWEKHGRKVGETRLGTQTEINNNENVKVFHITTEIRGGSEGRQAMTMMTDDSVIGGNGWNRE